MYFQRKRHFATQHIDYQYVSRSNELFRVVTIVTAAKQVVLVFKTYHLAL